MPNSLQILPEVSFGLANVEYFLYLTDEVAKMRAKPLGRWVLLTQVV